MSAKLSLMNSVVPVVIVPIRNGELDAVASAETNSDSFLTNTTWAATTSDAYGNSVMLNPLGNPFPNGVLQPTNGTLGLATNLGNPLATVLRNSHDPTSYNFNLGFEYQLPAKFIASAAWVGSRGLFIPSGYDLNQLSLQQIANYQSSLGNSVQLGIPDANWNPNSLASFGQVSYAASQPRQVQFGLRFTY